MLNWKHWATDELLGYYLANESGGDLVFDLAGNGPPGDVTGVPPWIAGDYGPELYLAVTDYVNFPDAAHPHLDQNFSALTLIYWFKARVNPSNDGLMGKGTIWYIACPNNTTFRFRHVNVGSGTTNVAVPAINDGYYHMGAATFDGVWINLYWDGLIIGSADTSGTGDGTLGTNSSRFGLGTYGSGNWSWSHNFSHAGIWKRCLDAGQILSLYMDPFQMFEPDPIDQWVGATSVGAVVGNAGIMTTNTGWWGPTF
jgi:hypothetical protein